ncbi:MAG: hypothetical protein ACFE0Q_11450 [Anaerolineae bacterium]
MFRKIRLYLSVSLIMLFGISAIVYAWSGSISNLINTDGGCEGIFFDVTALQNDIPITGFDSTFVGNVTVDVYYTPQSHQGNETNAGAWQLLGSAPVAGGSGFINTLYRVNVGGVVIPTGETYGFLLYTGSDEGTSSLATRYRVDDSSIIQNSDVRLTTNTASCDGDRYNPFDGILTDRAFHGVVYYGYPEASEAIRQQFVDGRLNRFDFAGAFVIYPHEDISGEQGLIFYDWYDDNRALLVVSADEIDAIPENPETNTLIASSADGRVSLYRLTTGEFQAQGPTQNGKTYVVIFDRLVQDATYTSYEE